MGIPKGRQVKWKDLSKEEGKNIDTFMTTNSIATESISQNVHVS